MIIAIIAPIGRPWRIRGGSVSRLHEIVDHALESPPQKHLAGLHQRPQRLGRDHVERPCLADGLVRPIGERAAIAGRDRHLEPRADGEARLLQPHQFRAVCRKFDRRHSFTSAGDRHDLARIAHRQPHVGRSQGVIVGDRALDRERRLRRHGRRDARESHRHPRRLVGNGREHHRDRIPVHEPVIVDEPHEHGSVDIDRRCHGRDCLRWGGRRVEPGDQLLHGICPIGRCRPADRHTRRRQRLARRACQTHDRSAGNGHDTARRRGSWSTTEVGRRRGGDLERRHHGRIFDHDAEPAKPGVAAANLHVEILVDPLEHVAKRLSGGRRATTAPHPLGPHATAAPCAELDHLRRITPGRGRPHEHVDVVTAGHHPPPVHEALWLKRHPPRPGRVGEPEHSPRPDRHLRRPRRRRHRRDRHRGGDGRQHARKPPPAEDGPGSDHAGACCSGRHRCGEHLRIDLGLASEAARHCR